MLSEKEVVRLYEDSLEAVAKNYVDFESDDTKGTIYESIVFSLGRVLEHEFTKITADIVSAKTIDVNQKFKAM